MFSIKNFLIATAGMASMSSAAPTFAGTTTPTSPFWLQYFERDASVVDPREWLPYGERDFLKMFEPTEGIPLDAVRELQPTKTQLLADATKFTLLGSYLHVSADEVPIPRSKPDSFQNYGWNSNNGLAGNDGPVQFAAKYFGPDGNMHMDPTTGAINIGGDYARFSLCKSKQGNGGNGEYLSFGNDTAAASCKPIFLYGWDGSNGNFS